MRLQRSGSEIAGFYSRDGLLWHQAGFGPTALPGLGEDAHFGLTANSGRDGTLATARFDQVALQPQAVTPFGIQACGADRSVLLQWRPLRNAVAYNVYRGAMDATRDQLVKLTAEGVAGASYLDSGSDLANGTSLLYAVTGIFRATDGSLVEGPLAAVAGTPVAVPAGLFGCGIAEGVVPGSAAFDPATGEITMRGSGWDVWQNGDQGYFLGQAVEGDVQATVTLVTRNTGAVPGRPAGLMIRESLDPGARVAAILQWANDGIFRQSRPETNHTSFGFLSILSAALRPPIVLRLTRRGDAVTPEYSLDGGQTFKASAPIRFGTPLPRTVYVGLIIDSGYRDKASQAKFRDLVIRKQ
jgi:hypothetical protein